MSALEYVGLVLEDQLLDHLVTPEGAWAIWKERLAPAVIAESDQGIRDALSFVLEYMDEHRQPPGPAILSEETGYEDFNEPVAPIDYVIEKLRERHQRQSLRKVITKMGRLSSGDPAESLHYGLDELLRIRVETAQVGRSISSRNLHGTVLDYRARKENPANGLSFGYAPMDQQLGGLMLGEVYVVVARPKRYKSWQVLKSANENFLAGKNVFFETMEMSEAEMRNRWHCMLTGISWYRFKHDHLTDMELDKLNTIADEIAALPNELVFHRSKIGERKAPLIIELAREKEAEVLYVDQLSWFDGAKDSHSWQVIGQIMEQLKDGSMHFPVMMAAQYNRAQAAEDGIGDIANIALADAVGQYADMVLGIYASQEMKSQGIIHYGVVESRSFEAKTWEIKVELSDRSNFKALNVVSDD